MRKKRNEWNLLKDCLVLIIVFCILLGVLGPILCSRQCPYSAFFSMSGDEAKHMVKNQQVGFAIEAEEYISSLNPQKSLTAYQHLLEEHLDLLVVVVTVNRDGDHKYLTRNLASLDRELCKEPNLNIGLIVCNAQIDSGLHKELEFLRSYFPVVDIHDESTEMKTRTTKKIRLKETDDYVDCLSIVYNQSPAQERKISAKYVLMLEDDAVIVEDAFSRIQDLIKLKLNAMSDWILVKLFYPDSYRGFQLNFHSILELISISLGMGVLLLMTLIKFILRRRKRLKGELILLVIMSTALSMITSLAFGRQHFWLPLLNTFRPLKLTQAPGSCTLAVLYPTSRIPALVKYVQDHPGNIDLVLRDFDSHNRHVLRSYLAENRFFRHIGYHSSLHKHAKSNAKEFLIM